MDKKHPAGVRAGRLPPCSARLLSKQRWRISIVPKFPLRKSALLQFQTLAGYTISSRSDCMNISLALLLPVLQTISYTASSCLELSSSLSRCRFGVGFERESKRWSCKTCNSMETQQIRSEPLITRKNHTGAQVSDFY